MFYLPKMQVLLTKAKTYKVQFRVFDLQTVARIVRAGEASSEAERRNEGSTKCVRNPEKREFAMQTRDEKMLCISRIFCEAKSHPKNTSSQGTLTLKALTSPF